MVRKPIDVANTLRKIDRTSSAMKTRQTLCFTLFLAAVGWSLASAAAPEPGELRAAGKVDFRLEES